MRRLSCVTSVEHHLNHAGGVAQVDEDDPAMVTAAGHPTGQGDGRAVVGGAQGAGCSVAEQEDSSGSFVKGGDPTILRRTRSAPGPAVLASSRTQSPATKDTG